MLQMDIKSRLSLINKFGPELVLECCRLWKTHGYKNYQDWGRCGSCQTRPLPTTLTYEQVDSQKGINNE